jgi:hypothetical protein
LYIEVQGMGVQGAVSRVHNEIVTHLLTNSTEPDDRGEGSATHQL